MPGNDLPAKKVDRLDLLARMLQLRNDGVALAQSQPSAAHDRRRWIDLQHRADALGRDWAGADPVDAQQLMPALLMGMPDLIERVDAAYLGAIRPSAVESVMDDEQTPAPARRR